MITSAIEIRQWNKERIKSSLQRLEIATKSDLARETGLSIATCSTALNEMLDSGEILKVDQNNSSIGRPSDIFSYDKDYLHILCLCFYQEKGQNRLILSVANALGHAISERLISLPPFTIETIESLIAQELQNDPLIKTIGISIPGTVADGVIDFCDIKPLEKVNFRDFLSEKYHVNVFVMNDINTITYYLYHSQNCSGNYATIYFPDEGDGYVGCGFIVNGHAVHGDTMLSGELFHVAEAFGIPLDKQVASRNDHDAFIKLATQILVTICCTINPFSVSIMGNGITEKDAAEIRSLCEIYISSRHVPNITISNNIFENYSACLIRKTLDCQLFPISV